MPIADQTQLEVATIVERIAEAVQPLQIWLFGSRARGDQHEHSDVDLLLVLDGSADQRACRGKAYGQLDGLDLSADIIVVTAEQVVKRGRVAGTLLNNALEEGKLVYEQEDPHIATALEWLDQARRDLLFTERSLDSLDEEPAYADQMSWLARQSLEKSIKAALFMEQIRVPLSHKLHELVELLPEAMREWTAGMDLHGATYQGLGGRYPDWGPNPTVEQVRQALSDARRFHDQLAAELQSR